MALTACSPICCFETGVGEGLNEWEFGRAFMLDIIIDMFAAIGDAVADLWVNKIVAKFKRE